MQLCKAAHGQHGVQSAEQVDGTLHDQDDADGHHQRFHGTEGVCDQDDAQHHAEHRQQQKALPAVVAAAAQVQGVLHPANGVKDDEQAEHDGQDTYHDIAAQQQKNTQCKADKAGDQGKLALEHPALHHKVADQLHRCAGQHHAAQRVADDVQRRAGLHDQKNAQPDIQQAHEDQVPLQLFYHRDHVPFVCRAAARTRVSGTGVRWWSC